MVPSSDVFAVHIISIHLTVELIHCEATGTVIPGSAPHSSEEIQSDEALPYNVYSAKN